MHDASKVLMVLRPAGSTKPIGPHKWVADTGPSFDIVPVRECSNDLLSEKVRLKTSVDMQTVNGPLIVDEGLRIAVPTLEKELDFLLLPNSPPIISVGKRCMIDGYEFHWPRGQPPYMVTPEDKRIDLVVDNFVPFISSEPGLHTRARMSGPKRTSAFPGGAV